MSLKVRCGNCAHSHLSNSDEPCIKCRGYSQYKEKPKRYDANGKEIRVIEVDIRKY